MSLPQFDLFGDLIIDVTEVPLAPVPADKATRIGPPSYGRRLTEKLRATAELGINPLVNTRGPGGMTCGDCIHRELIRYHNGTYPKCDLGPDTHGPKTDVRRYWPACHRWEPKP